MNDALKAWLQKTPVVDRDREYYESCPKVIGRCHDDCLDPRAGCEEKDGDVRVTVRGQAMGLDYTVNVQTLTSLDDEDRGGRIVRITCDGGQDGLFVPHAANIENGVEIHIAGDGEGIVFVNALVAACALLRPVSGHRR